MNAFLDVCVNTTATEDEHREEEEEVIPEETCLRCYDTHGLYLLAVLNGYVVSTNLIMRCMFSKSSRALFRRPGKS